MIFDAIVKVLLGLVSGLLGLFPAWTVPGSISAVGGAAGSWLGFANQYFPVTVLGIALGLVIGVRLFVFAVRLAVFVYELVPFKAT